MIDLWAGDCYGAGKRARTLGQPAAVAILKLYDRSEPVRDIRCEGPSVRSRLSTAIQVSRPNGCFYLEAIGYLRSKSLQLSEPDAATPDSCSARSGSVCLSKKLPISRTAIFPSGRK
jgi:hypothetical protein